LERFAKKTMTPLGYLYLDSPPDEELAITDFRTFRNQGVRRPSPDLIDTIHTMQLRQSWMRELLIEEGNEPLSFVGSGMRSQDFRELAKTIRVSLDLEPDWAESLPSWEGALESLRSAIERVGVLVFSNSVVGLNNHRTLDPEEFRGFVLCDSYAPVIFLNTADTKSAQMFTLAHELVHVWLGSDGLFNLPNMLPGDDAKEQFCNQVAAEFLIPGETLRRRWDEAIATESPLHTIARWHKVSPIVAARRALDLQLISQSEFFSLYEEERARWQKRKLELKKKKGGDFYSTQRIRLGQRFSFSVVRAVREGRMLYRDAFRLTGLKGETFNRYADAILQRIRDGGQ
jgi:Zn-dependent peptidase ImmA (M78 family)